MIVVLDVHLLFSPTLLPTASPIPAAVDVGSANAPEVLLGPSGATLDASVARHPAGGGR